MRAFVVMSCLLAGCLYIDPIEEHPSVTLRPAASDARLYRGGRFQVTADIANPDTFAWSAVACADLAGDVCNPTPFGTSNTRAVAEFDVPVWMSDQMDLTQSVTVSVVAHDHFGAVALHGRPSITYPVGDAAPELVLGTDPDGQHFIGAPITLLARFSDSDDPSSDIEVDWSVRGPDPSAMVAPGATVLGAPSTASAELVPLVDGAWTVQATARDKHGGATTQQLSFDVERGGPPCIAQSRPIVPPPGARLPLIEPTLFQVQRVDDDLDAFPRRSSDPRYGTTRFAWSIRVGDEATRRPIVGVADNAVSLDPLGFAPGEIVELRVEVFDRDHTQIACADGELACPSDPGASCVQRQSWQVEIR